MGSKLYEVVIFGKMLCKQSISIEADSEQHAIELAFQEECDPEPLVALGWGGIDIENVFAEVVEE